MGFSPLLLLQINGELFSDEYAVRSRKRTSSACRRSASGKEFLPGGDSVKIMISDLPLHSSANAWGSYGICYYTSLAPQFCFKWIANPLSKKIRPINAGLNRSRFIQVAHRGIRCATGYTGGCADCAAAFRSRASRAADSPLLPISFLALGRVDRFTRLDARRSRPPCLS